MTASLWKSEREMHGRLSSLASKEFNSFLRTGLTPSLIWWWNMLPWILKSWWTHLMCLDNCEVLEDEVDVCGVGIVPM